MKVSEIEWCTPPYQQSLELRHRVLREPLKLQFTAEELDAEAGDMHFGGWMDDQLIAVVSVRPRSATRVTLRQMAVAPDRQRQGFGRQLLVEVESRLVQREVEEIDLDARQTAIQFYQELGYHPSGELFIKVTLPHQKMVKRLS